MSDSGRVRRTAVHIVRSLVPIGAGGTPQQVGLFLVIGGRFFDLANCGRRLDIRRASTTALFVFEFWLAQGASGRTGAFNDRLLT